MDEEGIKLTWTAEGVAAVWLMANMPNAGRKEQVALGQLLQTTWYGAVGQAVTGVIDAIGDCPTVSAAQARMEAMLDDVKQAERAVKPKTKLEDFS